MQEAMSLSMATCTALLTLATVSKELSAEIMRKWKMIVCIHYFYSDISKVQVCAAGVINFIDIVREKERRVKFVNIYMNTWAKQMSLPMIMQAFRLPSAQLQVDLLLQPSVCHVHTQQEQSHIHVHVQSMSSISDHAAVASCSVYSDVILCTHSRS